MPCVEIPSHRFINEAKEFIAKYPLYVDSVHHKVILPLIAKDNDLSFVGCGKDNYVFVDPNNNERVVSVAFRNRTPVEAKMIYYLHNIFNSLWPHNFPHVYASSGSIDENHPSAKSVQRIPGFTSNRRSMYDNELFNDQTLLAWSNVKYPFREVTSACDKYRVPLPIDRYIENFISGEDGGEYYIDLINYRALKQPFPLDNVAEFMKEAGIEDSIQDSVCSKIRRFNELFDIYQKQLELENS